MDPFHSLRVECFGAGEKPGVDDSAVNDLVGGDEFNAAGAFGEGAGDAFVVYDELAHDDAVDEMRVEVGFLEAKCETGAQLGGAGGEEGEFWA